MVRGTFANVRLRNQLGRRRGRLTRKHFPDGEQIDDLRRGDAATPKTACRLSCSAARSTARARSRDWAAKGTRLLGVRAVIAESFERIHRSNLIGMGVLPLQFADGESVESLGLTGEEAFDVGDLDDGEAKTVHARHGCAETGADDDHLRSADGQARQHRTRSAIPKSRGICTGVRDLDVSEQGSAATCACTNRCARSAAKSSAGERGSARSELVRCKP